MGSELTIRLRSTKRKLLIRFVDQSGAAVRSEYWAEGVQCWYDTNRTMDQDYNHIHTREQLKNYDHALAKLCEEVLVMTHGGSSLRAKEPVENTSIAMNRKRHLK